MCATIRKQNWISIIIVNTKLHTYQFGDRPVFPTAGGAPQKRCEEENRTRTYKHDTNNMYVIAPKDGKHRVGEKA